MPPTGVISPPRPNETELREQQKEVLDRNGDRLTAFRDGRISVPVVVSGSSHGAYWSEVEAGETPPRVEEIPD